ncbi:MAG: TetR/AcrR family transcriptional regulator [Cellulomonas sp.]
MLRTPTTDSARRTRDKILDAALELFNDRGTAAVTTNHVATQAGISPGNLYYWFSDKDEIIRELYARLAGAYESMWSRDGADLTSVTPGELLRRMAAGADLSHRYAFLGRELLGLIHSDPLLAAEYATVREHRTATFSALARSWRSTGVMRPLDDQGIADLIQALWVIAEMWLAMGELSGRPVESTDGERLLRLVLEPYLLAGSITTR